MICFQFSTKALEISFGNSVLGINDWYEVNVNIKKKSSLEQSKTQIHSSKLWHMSQIDYMYQKYKYVSKYT